jgi:hypothetical protein
MINCFICKNSSYGIGSHVGIVTILCNKCENVRNANLYAYCSFYELKPDYITPDISVIETNLTKFLKLNTDEHVKIQISKGNVDDKI